MHQNAQHKRPRAIFLDRDGTLVADPGFVHRIEDSRLLPGVVSGLQRLSQSGYQLIIVTNQSGIQRGVFDLRDFETFQAHLLQDLARCGISIAATYFCPHRPEAGCECRKPAPGLVQRARQELNINLTESWMIGDRREDAELAQRAGLRGAVWIQSNVAPLARNAHQTATATAAAADTLQARDLVTAAELILQAEAKHARDASAK